MFSQSTSGYASWRLQIAKAIPFQWSVTDTDTFTTPAAQPIEVDIPQHEAGMLRIQMKGFGSAANLDNRQTYVFFGKSSYDVY